MSASTMPLRWLADMGFPQRLLALRRERNLTQQALSDMSGINIAQIRRYETGKSQPTLEVLRRLAVGLGTSIDSLAFDDHERGPGDDLRLQFEATSRLDADERKVLRELIDAFLLRHEARRYVATG